MKDALKKFFCWFYNSRQNPVRDKNGVVIDDWRSKRASKIVQKKIDEGELTLAKSVKGVPGKIKVLSKGEVKIERGKNG